MTLPSGWTVAPIADVVETRVKQAPPGDTPISYIDIGSIDRDAKRVGETEKVTSDTAPTRARQWVQQGDVLVSMTRPNLNAVALVTQELDGAVVSTGFDVLRPNGVLPEWLYYRVRGSEFVNDVCQDIQGVVYPAIRPDDIRRHALPIPPLDEQRRIVDVLDSHFSQLGAAVANLERARQRLQTYRASVLKAAVEGQLVATEDELAREEEREYEPANALVKRIIVERRRRWEQAEFARLVAAGKRPKNDDWKARYIEPISPDTSQLPELPEGWCWATMPQLGELARGKSMHRPRNDPRLLGGQYPFIQTGDVKAADTWIKTYQATYSELGLAQSRLWPAGTLCITIAANIAETAILSFDACFPDSVVGFLSGDPTITRYVELFLRTAREELERYAPATAQKNINLQTLSEVAVPIPPLAEQRRIIEELDRLLSVAAACSNVASANQHRCIRLRQSILKWAFEGKLVDQDPNDESAAKLLERIRTKRPSDSMKNTQRRKQLSLS